MIHKPGALSWGMGGHRAAMWEPPRRQWRLPIGAACWGNTAGEDISTLSTTTEAMTMTISFPFRFFFFFTKKFIATKNTKKTWDLRKNERGKVVGWFELGIMVPQWIGLTLLGLSDRVGHLWASFRIGLILITNKQYRHAPILKQCFYSHSHHYRSFTPTMFNITRMENVSSIICLKGKYIFSKTKELVCASSTQKKKKKQSSMNGNTMITDSEIKSFVLLWYNRPELQISATFLSKSCKRASQTPSQTTNLAFDNYTKRLP